MAGCEGFIEECLFGPFWFMNPEVTGVDQGLWLRPLEKETQLVRRGFNVLPATSR